MADVEGKLSHYKKYLERYFEDKSREHDVLKILKKLDHLPVTLDHLQLTGIGKTVNSYRKHDGDIGRESKALVSKWKLLVPSVKVQPKQTSIQCETISETSYSAREAEEQQCSSDTSKHRVPYLKSGPVQSTSSSENVTSDKSSKHHNTNHHGDDEANCDKAKDKRKKHKHSHEKKHSSHNSSKHEHKKERSEESRGKREEKKELNSVQLHSKHQKDSNSASRKRKADFTSDCSSHERRKQEKEIQKEGEDDTDNGGLSFEDLLMLDEQLLKKQKTKKKSVSVESRSSSSSKSHAKETLQNRKLSDTHTEGSTRHSSSHRHSELDKGKSLNHELKPSRDSTASKSDQKTKTHQFSVPAAPSTQISLSESEILGDLPQTNPNYHPLPRVVPKEPDKTPKTGILIDEELLSNKRYTKTQVYSGKRAIYLQEVPRLYDACLRVLMDNIDNLEYVGGVPVEILKPVLMKCSASQLYTIEEYNPHFVGETDDIWEKLCNKEFRYETPEEFESWRELYLRKHDEREARLKRLTSNIAESFAKKQEPVKKTKLAYVDTVAKAPRHVVRQQIKHGTAGPIKQDPLSQLTSHGGQPVKHVVSQDHVQPPNKKRKQVPPMMQKAMKLFKSMRR